MAVLLRNGVAIEVNRVRPEGSGLLPGLASVGLLPGKGSVVVKHWMDRLLAVTGFMVALAEMYAIQNSVPGDTISERTRVYFRIKQQNTGKAGAFVFLAFLGSLSAWFAAHITK